MKRWLKSHPALLVRRLALLYAVLALCRAIFYLYNRSLIGPIPGGELWPLVKGSLQFDTVSVLYANALFVLLSLLPTPLRERRWYRSMLFWYYTAVNAVLVVALNLADAVYFHYTQKRFTAEELFFADNENSLALALRFAAENWYMVLAGIGLIALLVLGYGRRIRPESPLRPGWCYYLSGSALLAAALLLAVAGIRGGVTRATRPITLSNATLYATSAERANLILSNPFCVLRTAGSGGATAVPRYYDPDELARHFTPIHRPDTSAIDLGARNVVIFIMESMSAEQSAHLRPDLYEHLPVKGFTPFLDSLMREGFCFTRMYANGMRSIQAMPAILGSIPSFRTPFVLMPQSLGRSRQLPRILADRGYTTAFFCGSERGSMGFGAYARSAGVQRLISREEYEARHGKGDFDGSWGIWDGPFLQFTGEELDAMPEPFFASLFTLSAHHPFEVPASVRDSLPEGFTSIQRPAAYDDLAFRRFFERFGDREWFRRTLFVFVADHVSSEKWAPETRSFPGNYHIVGFLHTPDGALRGQCTQIVQQIDLMPTLLGLLGNREPYFAYGRDVLNEPDRTPWAVMYDTQYRAMDDCTILSFDGERLTGLTVREGDIAAPALHAEGGTAGQGISSGPTPAHPHGSGDEWPESSPEPSPTAEPLLNRLRGMIQQYYRHIETKNYTVEE